MSCYSCPLEGRTNQAIGNHRGNAVITITETPKRKGGYKCRGLDKIKILLDTDRYFQIGASMEEGDKIKVLLLLIQNMVVFA